MATAKDASAPKRKSRKDTPEHAAKSMRMRAEHRAEEKAVRAEVRGWQKNPSDWRSWLWTPELIDEFERRITNGAFVNEIAGTEGFPKDPGTIWAAISTKESPVSLAYTRGKQNAVARLEELIVAEAAKPRTSVIEFEQLDKDGNVVTLTRKVDNTERSKIHIDALKWTLAHVRPKKHGRHADEDTNKGPNEQLKALFDALNAGPADTEGEEQ